MPRARPAHLGEKRSAQVPLEKGHSHTALAMPLLHNWVEHVYKAFNQGTFPTGAKQIALLGVRELAEQTTKKGEPESFSSLDRPVVRGKLGPKGGDQTTTFNDKLFAVWAEEKAEKGTKARVYACTIDTSIDTNGTTGSPYLLEGKLYHAEPCRHHPTGSNGPALRVYTGSSGTSCWLGRRPRRSVYSETSRALWLASPRADLASGNSSAKRTTERSTFTTGSTTAENPRITEPKTCPRVAPF